MFKGKVVIVTGASSGIGAVTAEMFAKEGANVSLVGRSEEKLNCMKGRCERHGTKALVIKADLSKDDEARKVVEQTIEEFAKLDVLVNNAGILKYAKVTNDKAVEVFDEVINTNLRSVVLLTNLAAPHLIETKGNIVNISSTAGLAVPTTWPGLTMYATSKAGMDHFTRGCALELSSFGVRVNSVNPGPVITDTVATDIMCPIKLEHMKCVSPLGRFSDAEEIGDMILYLASDKARGMTGSSVVIDNGVLLK